VIPYCDLGSYLYFHHFWWNPTFCEFISEMNYLPHGTLRFQVSVYNFKFILTIHSFDFTYLNYNNENLDCYLLYLKIYANSSFYRRLTVVRNSADFLFVAVLLSYFQTFSSESLTFTLRLKIKPHLGDVVLLKRFNLKTG